MYYLTVDGEEKESITSELIKKYKLLEKYDVCQYRLCKEKIDPDSAAILVTNEGFRVYCDTNCLDDDIHTAVRR